jgi:ABC-type multidrug transport system fused ATPase/permease subunit
VSTDTTWNVTETGPGALGRLRVAAGVFSRFWPYTRGDRLRLLLAGIALITVPGCEIAAVLLFDVITTRALQDRRLAGFWTPAGAWLASACVAALAMFAAGYLTSLAGERFMLRLRDAVFAHAQRLSPGFFEERRLGDLMVRLTGDVEVVEQLACSGLVTTACSAISVILFAGAAVAALPEGYQTVVGQGGQPLSGGQRQRIAIARALIRDAPVLILDEPTTGLDEAGAQRTMALLRDLMAGRTAILITHDLRLVDGADQVLVLGETMPGRWSMPAATAVA